MGIQSGYGQQAAVTEEQVDVEEHQFEHHVVQHVAESALDELGVAEPESVLHLEDEPHHESSLDYTVEHHPLQV